MAKLVSMVHGAFWVSFGLVVLTTTTASAQTLRFEASPPSSSADTVTEQEQPAPSATPRPWLYTADPAALRPLQVIAALGVGYAQVDRGAARPFAADKAHAGAVFDAGAEVGVTSWASLHAQGLLAGDGSGGPMRAGVFTGASFFPLPAQWPVDVALSGGYLRELGGDNAVWGRVGVAGNIGRARLSLTALGEHVFAANRDGVDILITTGASVALTSFAHLGAEYVVQDLEGAWEPEEADGGIRHFIGPAAILLLAPNVQISAGPAFGLSPGSPPFLGRLVATYLF